MEIIHCKKEIEQTKTRGTSTLGPTTKRKRLTI
jgi:hypothetical protein